MNLFDGAKESYVDGQEACVEWNVKKGYIIRFTMPAHDIEVYCVEKNLMKIWDLEMNH